MSRRATVALFGAHVAYGAALMIAPDRLTRAWLGPGSASLRVAVRSVAGREIALHSLGIVFVLAGSPVKPWLAASLAGDLNDIAATVLGRGGLPDGAMPKTAAAAGGSAALTAAVLASE